MEWIRAMSRISIATIIMLTLYSIAHLVSREEYTRIHYEDQALETQPIDPAYWSSSTADDVSRPRIQI